LSRVASATAGPAFVRLAVDVGIHRADRHALRVRHDDNADLADVGFFSGLERCHFDLAAARGLGVDAAVHAANLEVLSWLDLPLPAEFLARIAVLRGGGGGRPHAGEAAHGEGQGGERHAKRTGRALALSRMHGSCAPR
jgi:hypothetical protein